MSMNMNVITDEDRDAILAGLGLLHNLLDGRFQVPSDLQELVVEVHTNGGIHKGLTSDQIADLCDRLNQ